MALLIAVLSLFASARLDMRFGERTVLLGGLAFVVGGLVLFARAPIDATYLRDVLPAVVLLGIGAGLSFPSLTTFAMRGVQPGEAGLRVGAHQHVAAGRRRARARGPRLAVGDAHRQRARRRRLRCRGDPRGLSLRLLDVAAGIAAAAIAVALLVLRSAPAQAAPAEERMAEALLESA